MRSHAMAVRVGIGEDARLKHFVGRPTDAGHKVRRAEHRLLDLDEGVTGITVQLQSAGLFT